MASWRPLEHTRASYARELFTRFMHSSYADPHSVLRLNFCQSVFTIRITVSGTFVGKLSSLILSMNFIFLKLSRLKLFILKFYRLKLSDCRSPGSRSLGPLISVFIGLFIALYSSHFTRSVTLSTLLS